MDQQGIEIVVERLLQIYDAVQAIPSSPRGEIRPIDFSSDGPPSRIDSVRDRRSGLEYAAWCIGETLAAQGGRDLMEKVYEGFEQWGGSRASSWLDHRWDGAGAAWFA